MFRLLFLLPIILCAGWYLFLRNNGVPIKQGKKGFMYILVLSAFVLGFFVLMMQITEYAPSNL
jgi:heme/copper-type cytochrome/quinol oxidase subunit 3|tara:strand:- start:7305 stop:7493 length:189 start_codon:yes stop_codon:yes gene_type:complete